MTKNTDKSKEVVSNWTEQVQYCKECGERLESDDIEIKVTEQENSKLWYGACPYCSSILSVSWEKLNRDISSEKRGE